MEGAPKMASRSGFFSPPAAAAPSRCHEDPCSVRFIPPPVVLFFLICFLSSLCACMQRTCPGAVPGCVPSSLLCVRACPSTRVRADDVGVCVRACLGACVPGRVRAVRAFVRSCVLGCVVSVSMH